MLNNGFGMNLALMYPPLNLRGFIKCSANDFVVKEIPLEVPLGRGEHVYLKIRKRHANTHWVAQQLAEFCDLRPVDIGYAGRKDRHALTEQWFSCYLPKAEPSWEKLSIEGVEVLSVERHFRKLRRGDLRGNDFAIKVSQISSKELLLRGRLNVIRDKGFPNYFGVQRFGRDNLARAQCFLRKAEERVGERGMLISAMRAYLFNECLSSFLNCGSIPEYGPLFGRSRDPQVGENILSRDSLFYVDRLRRLRVRADRRVTVVRPLLFRWCFQQDFLLLSFRLPPGSYATSLLRESVEIEDLRGREDFD